MLIDPHLRKNQSLEEKEWDDEDNKHALQMAQELCSKVHNEISHLKDRVFDSN